MLSYVSYAVDQGFVTQMHVRTRLYGFVLRVKVGSQMAGMHQVRHFACSNENVHYW